MKTAQQRDAVNAHKRELRAVNRDAKLAKRRAEYSTNRDKINEQKRAWYQANIERERAHNRVRERQRWQENPEKLRVQARIRNAHNPEPNRKRVKAWQLAHPERFREQLRVHKQKRRARKKGNGGSWTAKEWATLKRQYGYYCVGCWKTERELQALGRKLVPDHIVALDRGGLNIVENLQPLCHGKGGCNNRKGNKYVDFVIS